MLLQGFPNLSTLLLVTTQPETLWTRQYLSLALAVHLLFLSCLFWIEKNWRYTTLDDKTHWKKFKLNYRRGFVWVWGVVWGGSFRLSKALYSYLLAHGKKVPIWITKGSFFPMHPLQGFICSIIKLLCLGAHSDIHWCREFLLQESQKYNVSWLV